MANREEYPVTDKKMKEDLPETTYALQLFTQKIGGFTLATKPFERV